MFFWAWVIVVSQLRATMAVIVLMVDAIYGFGAKIGAISCRWISLFSR